MVQLGNVKIPVRPLADCVCQVQICPLTEEVPIRSKELQAVVLAIGGVHLIVIFRVYKYAMDGVELPRSAAMTAPGEL